jgi:acyl-CoA thioesterase-1
MLLELPYHFAPRAEPISGKSLAVIGDSVTAGVDDGSQTWPTLLAAAHNLNVQDISHVGDTAESALKRVRKDPIDAPLVVIEIGGNDLLGSTTARQFEQDLDALLTELAEPGRQLVMFELPLPPLYHEYGRAQRQVARKHGAKLIPKRQFLNIIAPKEATLDTIHLSAGGQRQMADCVWRVIGPAYE